MRHLSAALIVFFSGFFSLTQPGLCPCWLLPDVNDHPHLDGHPERPHRHDYLFNLFQSNTPAAAPPVVIPINEIIAALNASGHLRLPGHAPQAVTGWQAAVEPPPPR
jgi:hypothetical protein